MPTASGFSQKGSNVHPTWTAALVFLALSLLFAMGPLIAAMLLRVKARVDLPTKFDTYE